MLSMIYGPPYWHQKAAFWEKLSSEGVKFQGPWAVMRDFNYIHGQVDKRGGRPWASSSVDGLYQLTMSHGLLDIDFVGNSYTWKNGREGGQAIFERLDRGIANGP